MALTFAADKALGARVAHGFALAGLPASADLLAALPCGEGHRGQLPGRGADLEEGAGQRCFPGGE